MSENIEYVLVGVKSYGRNFLGSVGRILELAGGEESTEGGIKIWRSGSRVLADGFSVGSTEIARISKDVLSSIFSEFSTKPVHPLDDYRIVVPYSQSVYHELLTMYRQWALGRKLSLLMAALAVIFVAAVRLLILSSFFPQYESLFELFSYAIGVLPLCLGAATLWYMYSGHRALLLIETVAEPSKPTALLIRLPRLQEHETSTDEGEDKGSELAGKASDSRLGSLLEESVSDLVRLPKHELYVLAIDGVSQDGVVTQLQESGGTILSVGQPHTMHRALFYLRITSLTISGLLFLLGLVLSRLVWGWLFGYPSSQFWLAFLSSLFVLLMATRLLRENMWLWLEERLLERSPPWEEAALLDSKSD